MYCRDQESLNWLAQCTWLMAADQYLIVLAISCIGSFRGEAHIESQASSPCGLPCGVPCHGLSTLIGAVRPLLCSDGLELSDANYIFRCAMIWPTIPSVRSEADDGQCA